jgi:DNA repair photolyase
MAQSRMFSFITETRNPIGGECPYACVYCWARFLAQKYGMRKYQGAATLSLEAMKKRVPCDAFIFVSDMRDAFSLDIDDSLIGDMCSWIGANPQAQFLLLTKNPRRYLALLAQLPENTILGATIESNRPYVDISQAPSNPSRIIVMQELRKKTSRPLFISIEPGLDFDFDDMAWLEELRPWGVAVGYDNYGNHLPEPPLGKTWRLIEWLEGFTTVYRKNLNRGGA